MDNHIFPSHSFYKSELKVNWWRSF